MKTFQSFSLFYTEWKLKKKRKKKTKNIKKVNFVIPTFFKLFLHSIFCNAARTLLRKALLAAVPLESARSLNFSMLLCVKNFTVRVLFLWIVHFFFFRFCTALVALAASIRVQRRERSEDPL